MVVWRKVVDGKYTMQSSLLEWIRARRPASQSSPCSPRPPPLSTTQPPRSTVPEQLPEDIARAEDMATRERVKLLREQVEVALAEDVGQGGEASRDGAAAEGPENATEVDELEEEGEVGPDPDPVFGFHEPPPTGYDLKDFVVHRKRLHRDDLTKDDVRSFLIWEIQEATFRFQVRQLDKHVLKSSRQWSAGVEKERRALWPKIWGGLDGFVPSGIKTPAQTDPGRRVRLAAVYHLWKMVSKWPRCSEVPNLRNRSVDKGLSLEELGEIEQAVWKFYAQTFLDYFGFLPTIPTCMPRNPFIE
ncbi:hypothetical protein AURDEDRAFT_117655 [Auricularia subglabra TFB-10046 SS5]|uniref:Uncharacterized protein n=1 Tax=Auricularia subglabra (strain TFB-10046 / SS5) TaxID=717982 RepID=J0CV88_AURST|nr:hypothetical protein AURDEDRAFT_117655 [Auricularia subglabra TFB-10046 SS5]